MWTRVRGASARPRPFSLDSAPRGCVKRLYVVGQNEEFCAYLFEVLHAFPCAPAATSNCTRRGHFKMYQPERCKVRRCLV